MNTNIRAIVLSKVNYGESTLIIDLFSRESGRLTVSTTISKKKNNRHYYSPLAVLDLSIYKSKGKFYRIKEVKNAIPEQLINQDSEVHAIRYFLAELLKHVLKTEAEEIILFDYILDQLKQMYEAEKKGGFVLDFLEGLTPYLGIDIAEIEEGEASWKEFGFELDKDELEMLRKRDKKNAKQYLNALLRFYSHHIDGIQNLKSKSILAEVFA